MILALSGLHVFYGKSHILRGIDLSVAPGEIVALIGRNGAGKTTTLRTIMGLTSPREGRILFDGMPVEALPPFKRSRLGLGYVPQEKLLFKKMTVLENLKTAARDRRDADLGEVFDLFPRLEDRLGQKAGTLSGGEQQMLTIARAMLTRPRLLLLDEPSTGLMPAMIGRLAEVIRVLNERGLAILLVEEQIPLALHLASRLYIMDVGRMVHACDTQAIRQEELIEKYMGVTC